MPDLYHFQYRLIRKILAHTDGVSHLQMGRQPPDLDGILTGECHGYDDYYNCGTCQPQSPSHGLARRPLEH
jgi:hypothetical protein